MSTNKNKNLNISPISHPLADKKLRRKCIKLIRKIADLKQSIRGTKMAMKSLKRNKKGLLIMASDVYPIDVLSHIVIFSEEKSVPYVFAADKQTMGTASLSKRPTTCIFVAKPKKTEKYYKLYKRVRKEIENLDKDISKEN